MAEWTAVDRIDVWVAELRRSPEDEALLAERELARAARLRIDEKRDQLVAGQALLRRILGARLATEPADLVFGYGAHGKPWLPTAPELGFNLSHSGGVATVALAADTDLGVDIELSVRERPFARLARRFFAPREYRWLEAHAAADQAEAFYRVWTLKEAYLKATGTGLSFPPHAFVVDLDGSLPRLLSTDRPGDRAERWSMQELDLTQEAEYAGALCWRGAPREVRIHRVD